MLRKNIGTPGRIIRGAIGLGLLVYAWIQISWIAFFCAVFVLFEAVASWCVVYQLLGKNSCPSKNPFKWK